MHHGLCGTMANKDVYIALSFFWYSLLLLIIRQPGSGYRRHSDVSTSGMNCFKSALFKNRECWPIVLAIPAEPRTEYEVVPEVESESEFYQRIPNSFLRMVLTVKQSRPTMGFGAPPEQRNTSDF